MSALERRLARLEAEERRRILAMPPRDILASGHIRFAALTDPERHELVGLLETVFDDRGYVDRRRLTPEQQQRALALLDKARGEAA